MYDISNLRVNTIFLKLLWRPHLQLCGCPRHLNCVSRARQRVHRDMSVLPNTAHNAFITLLMGPLIKMFRDAVSGLIEMPASSYLQCK